MQQLQKYVRKHSYVDVFSEIPGIFFITFYFLKNNRIIKVRLINSL